MLLSRAAVASAVVGRTFPLIMRGMASDSIAVNRWDPKYLAGQLDTLDVLLIGDRAAGVIPYDAAGRMQHASLTFREAYRTVTSLGRGSIPQIDIPEGHGLWQDLDLTWLRELEGHSKTTLWVSKDTRSGAHFDNSDNVLVQIFGRKRAVLASRDQSHLLSPFAGVPSRSPVDLHEDADRGGADVVHALEGTLHPGDGLFIPKGWWHSLQALGVSISVNTWFGPLEAS